MRAVWLSAARLKACRNIENILNPVLGVTQRNWITSCRMQVRLQSDRLSGTSALSSRSPPPPLNHRYCGDWGLWVTDGGWVTSAIVNGSRRVNPSQTYKELKGCTRGQGHMTTAPSKTGTQSRTSLCFHKIPCHPSIHRSTHSHEESYWGVLSWPNEHVCV